MISLSFNVSGQKITRTDTHDIIGDSVGQFEAIFTFDEWWSGYTAYALFTKNGISYKELIENGKCEVPYDAIQGRGAIYVSVFSCDGNGNRKTANRCHFYVMQSGYDAGAIISESPSETFFDKIASILNFIKGGTTGQILRKKSALDNDAKWEDLKIGTNDISNYAITTEKIASSAVGRLQLDDTMFSVFSVSDNYKIPLNSAVFAELLEKATAYTDMAKIQAPSASNVNTVFIWLGLNGVVEQLTWSVDLSSGHTYMCMDTGTGYKWIDLTAQELSFKQYKNRYFSNVSASSWVADTTYTDYGYKCDISLTGVTGSMLPEVVFGVTEATSGNYAPVAVCGSGTVTVYSKVNTAITIPSIKCEVAV